MEGSVYAQDQNIKAENKLFDNYLPVSNLDSLKSEIQKNSKNTADRTDLLLKYEFSYMQLHGLHSDYMNELVRIYNESTDTRREGVFNYVFGSLPVLNDSLGRAYWLGNALRNFSEANDTTGLVHCYKELIYVNFGPLRNLNRFNNRAKEYMQKLVQLANMSSQFANKIIVEVYKAEYPFLLNELTNVDSTIQSLDSIIEETIQKPQYASFLYQLYTAKGTLFFNEGAYKDAAKAFSQIQIEENWNSFKYLSRLNNMAAAFYQLGDFEKSAELNEMVISHYDYENVPLRVLYREAFSNLGLIYLKKSPLLAADYMDKALDLSYVMERSRTTDLFRELNAFIELNRGFSQIETLSIEKSKIEDQMLQIKLLLLGSIILVLLFNFLAFKAYGINKRLKRVTRSRDKLFTIISHDLKSPLSAYLGIADDFNYLLKTKQFDKIESLSKKIDLNSVNLQLLMDNLFQWSSSELVELVPEKKKYSLDKLLYETISLYKNVAQLRNIKFLDDSNHDFEVYTDKNLFLVVIRNLLDNAIKYAPVSSVVTVTSIPYESHYLLRISNEFDESHTENVLIIQKLFNSNSPVFYGEKRVGLGLKLIREFSNVLELPISFGVEDKKCSVDIKLSTL